MKKNLKFLNTKKSIMNTVGITFRTLKVSPKDLKACPLMEKFGYDKPDLLFINEAKRYGHLEMPVVTSNMLILTHEDSVHAAIEMGLDEFEVLVADGLDDDEIPRFLNYKKRFKGKRDYAVVNEIIEFLYNHLQNTAAGREWEKEIPGNTIRAKVASLIGYADSMVSHIVKIAKYCPEQLPLLTAGEATFTKVLEVATKAKSAIENANQTNSASIATNRFSSSSTSPVAFSQPTGSASTEFLTANQTAAPAFASNMQTGQPSFAAPSTTALPAVGFEGLMAVLNKIKGIEENDRFIFREPFSNNINVSMHICKEENTTTYYIEEDALVSDKELNKQFSIEIYVRNLQRA